MPKQSGYLQRQAAREQAIIDAVDQTARQLMLDTLQITLHTEYGWGFDRIKALSEAWAKVYNQLHGAVERVVHLGPCLAEGLDPVKAPAVLRVERDLERVQHQLPGCLIYGVNDDLLPGRLPLEIAGLFRHPGLLSAWPWHLPA